jgi:hypothetical protein
VQIDKLLENVDEELPLALHRKFEHAILLSPQAEQTLVRNYPTLKVQRFVG